MSNQPTTTAAPLPIPEPVLWVFRGIGQVFFQENALTGLLFTVGIVFSLPVQAAGMVAGALIGTLVAYGLKFDRGQLAAGIWGFNPALVGIATLFFFKPGPASIALLVIGCIAVVVLTRFMRQYVPFPTYTTPFILTTWVIFFAGKAMGATTADAGSLLVPQLQVNGEFEAIAHGIGQVMFQASVWTGLLFLIGIAIGDRQHAAWVLVASIIGMAVAGYHVDAAMRSLDAERLVERDHFENIRLGLYGYNATLAAVALFLWRRSVVPPILGILLTVPLTEIVPRLGLPALTAPFVLATWLVMALAWLDVFFFKNEAKRK